LAAWRGGPVAGGCFGLGLERLEGFLGAQELGERGIAVAVGRSAPTT